MAGCIAWQGLAPQCPESGGIRRLAAEDAGSGERQTEELEGSEKAPAGRFPRTTLAVQVLDVATLKETLGSSQWNAIDPRDNGENF